MRKIKLKIVEMIVVLDHSLIVLFVIKTAPNMEAITASLERSLQNCSLNNNNNNNHERRREEEEEGSGFATEADAGLGISSSSDDVPNSHISNSDTTLELNSHLSLPYHWEQCLDLKTGEIYYINWRNGKKAKEDPRRGEYSMTMSSRDYESEEESWYDSEESSSESSSNNQGQVEKQQNVLVVAGCKTCLMYFMVPKQVEDCPKCTGQLLHFDRSQNVSP